MNTYQILQLVGLFLGILYSVPVVIGGAVRHEGVSTFQVLMWSSGWSLFIYFTFLFK